MAIDDASTALAPAASISDPPVSTGMRRALRGLAAGLVHCIEDGTAAGRSSRRLPAPPARVLPAVMARGAPEAPACRACPSGPPDAALHP